MSGVYASKWDGPRFHLETRYFVEWTCFFYGSQDDRLHAWIRKHVKSDWVTFDIGANFGFYSMLLAKHSPQGEVHSFEPVPWLSERFERNAKLNGFEGRISKNELAVSNSAGWVDLNIPAPDESNQGTASLVEKTATRKTIKVRTITLDEYVRTTGVSRLDFIKVDVEGAEHFVIQGAVESIKKFRPFLVVEVNESSRQAVADVLGSLGYRSEILPRLRWRHVFNEGTADMLYSP